MCESAGDAFPSYNLIKTFGEIRSGRVNLVLAKTDTKVLETAAHQPRARKA